MEIGLTDQVRKMCGFKPLPAPAEDVDPFFCWDMARVDLGARKVLVMSNAGTSVCAVTRMAGADWKHIDEVARQLVEEAIACCGSNPADYFSLAGDLAITKTHGRRAVGTLTLFGQAIWPDQIDMSEKVQRDTMMFFNHRYLTRCVSHDGYEYPAVRFAQDLAEQLAKRP
jgi:hypothetical protein